MPDPYENALQALRRELNALIERRRALPPGQRGPTRKRLRLLEPAMHALERVLEDQNDK